MGELTVYLGIFLLGLFLGGGIVFFLFRKGGQAEQKNRNSQNHKKKRLENQDSQDMLLKKQDDLVSIWREAAEENWQAFRKLRHGYINALVSIRQYIRKERKEESLAYVDGLLAELEAEAGKGRQGNSWLHVFLSYKIRQQEQSGIVFSREILAPAEFSLAQQDISQILGLAFDMAVETVNKLPLGERRIDIKIVYKKQAFKLLLEYPCDSSRQWDSSLLSQLEKAVEQRQGMADLSMEGGCCQVKVLLYGEQK